MRRALVVCAVLLVVFLLGSPAWADVFAVAKPETQTAAINGTAAEFDGSDSYAEDPPCYVAEWAWDFDGDGEDDYTEDYGEQWGDGLTTYVYEKAGIFTCRLTVTDEIERQDTDTQEVKVRLEVTSGEINGTSVELLWDNANDASQFTRYEVHKSTTEDFTPDANSLVTNITNMATTSYTVTGLTPRTTYYFQVVLVVTGGSLQSNEVQQATGSYHGTKLLYDEAGSLTKVVYTDDGGSTWQTSTYQYDDVYALTKVTFPDSKTVSYIYDKAGQRTRMIDPASNVVTYLYDDRGYLTKVSVGGSSHGTYYYDDAGRRTRLLYGNSSYASYLYDDANHLTLISNRKSDNDVISSFAYTVDDTGNRTRLTLSNGDYADYVYDDTYQLTREHRKDSGDSTLYYNNFYYDAAGNRTRLEYNDGGTTTTSYLYNTADQLTRETVGGTNTDYLYDANGSLTKKDDGTNVHSYGYDYRNLMTDYDGPGSSNDSTYKYDAFGRRITKDVNGTKTAYFHDLLNVVAEYNGSNQLQRTYVTPGLDQNLSLTASGTKYYYLSDALGSIRQVIDANEATQNSYDYFAFGKAYGTPTENVTQPFRYTGRSWDAETSLYYYRARYYASGSGLFLRRDPLGPRWGVLAYLYCANAPVSYFDPMGLTRKLTDFEACILWAAGFQDLDLLKRTRVHEGQPPEVKRRDGLINQLKDSLIEFVAKQGFKKKDTAVATWPDIWFPGKIDSRRRDKGELPDMKWVAHEVDHLEKQKAEGDLFYKKYAKEYIANLAKRMSPTEAYEGISYEQEARWRAEAVKMLIKKLPADVRDDIGNPGVPGAHICNKIIGPEAMEDIGEALEGNNPGPACP